MNKAVSDEQDFLEDLDDDLLEDFDEDDDEDELDCFGEMYYVDGEICPIMECELRVECKELCAKKVSLLGFRKVSNPKPKEIVGPKAKISFKGVDITRVSSEIKVEPVSGINSGPATTVSAATQIMPVSTNQQPVQPVVKPVKKHEKYTATDGKGARYFNLFMDIINEPEWKFNYSVKSQYVNVYKRGWYDNSNYRYLRVWVGKRGIRIGVGRKFQKYLEKETHHHCKSFTDNQLASLNPQVAQITLKSRWDVEEVAKKFLEWAQDHGFGHIW